MLPEDWLFIPCRKATWRVEIQGLVCLLYVAAGPDFPERMPELTLQVLVSHSHLAPQSCHTDDSPIAASMIVTELAPLPAVSAFSYMDLVACCDFEQLLRCKFK